jgi:energy-coupling factor transporter transmembrane protein EcfT
MKKFVCLIAALFLATMMIASFALAEEPVNPVVENAEAPAAAPTPIPTDPFDWGQLATIAGATLATLLIVQLLKLPLDKVWKIPTRIVVYVIALIIMIAATYFTGGLTWEKVGLAAVNAVIVALAAMGSYELTFAKLDAKKKQ